MNIQFPHPILFITSNLGGGGAERALVTILNRLDRHRFQPHLALFQQEGVFLAELAPDIPLYEIQPDDRGFLRRNLRRFTQIRDLVIAIQPKLVVSVLWQVNAVSLLAARLWRLDVPILILEQNSPQASTLVDARRRILWPFVARLYRRANHISAVSRGIAEELAHTCHLPAGKLSVIYNPVDLKMVAGPPPVLKQSQKPALLAVGRLKPQKNYPLLLQAIALVRQKMPVDLYILGEGSEETKIRRLIIELELSNAVHLLGFVSEPWPYLKQADIFVLSSDFEGFGNVLIEAMAMGTAVISTDCPYGPREILQDGACGLLVPVNDPAALANAIQKLLQNPELRQKFAQLGCQRAQDFSVARIVAQYEALFAEMIAS